MRASNVLRHARDYLADTPPLEPVLKGRSTFKAHLGRILRRWHSLHTNARLEGLSGLFQAARARARGYRNETTFIAMSCLVAAPLGGLVRA